MATKSNRQQAQRQDRLRAMVAGLKADGIRCNCDLDNWEPEQDTGHSWVCRIHKAAKQRMAKDQS